jgi:transposase
MARKRWSFTEEHKREAVRIIQHSGRTVQEVAQDLGIRSDLLSAWRRRYGGTEPAGRSTGSLEEENRRLQRELQVARQERDFAKKVATFFAKGPERSSS